MISVEPETGYPLCLQEDTALIARRVGGAAAVAYILVNLAAWIAPRPISPTRKS